MPHLLFLLFFLLSGQPQKVYNNFVSKAMKLFPPYFEIILKVKMSNPFEIIESYLSDKVTCIDHSCQAESCMWCGIHIFAFFFKLSYNTNASHLQKNAKQK